MEEARFLWDDIMTRHGKQAEYWLENVRRNYVRMSVRKVDSGNGLSIFVPQVDTDSELLAV